MDTSARNALAVGFTLMEYRVTAVLGAGAFGITYLARDLNLEKDAAIKEFFPDGVAARTADGQVVPAAAEREEVFRWGLQRFVAEARTLAALNHAHIVRVSRYFEAHGTAYVVMDYERGESLKSFVARRGPVPESELKALLAPLLDGLERVHEAGYLHRDIKPDNILVRQDGGLVLLDFGSARRTLPAPDQALTAIVSPGYAPVEQYSEAHEQGPWSDLYALGAVLYFVVTGKRPPDSLARMRSDTVRADLEAARQRYSAPFIDAIAWALSWDDSVRPRSVAAWRGALLPAAAQAGSTQAGDPEHTVRLSAEESEQATKILVQPGGSDTSRAAGLAPGESPSRPADSASLTAVDALGLPERGAGAWSWMAPYLAVAVVVLVIALALGSLELFERTILVRSRSWFERLFSSGGRQDLTAAQLVRAIGYVGTLFILWALARRAAAQLGRQGTRWAALGRLLLPLATLVALPSAYAALLPAASPLMDETATAVYNWTFALATVATGGWLGFTLFRNFAALGELVRPGATHDGGAPG